MNLHSTYKYKPWNSYLKAHKSRKFSENKIKMEGYKIVFVFVRWSMYKNQCPYNIGSGLYIRYIFDVVGWLLNLQRQIYVNYIQDAKKFNNTAPTLLRNLQKRSLTCSTLKTCSPLWFPVGICFITPHSRIDKTHSIRHTVVHLTVLWVEP